MNELLSALSFCLPEVMNKVMLILLVVVLRNSVKSIKYGDFEATFGKNSRSHK